MRTGSKMAQVLQSCSQPGLSLKWAGELSLSGHLVAGPAGEAVFVGASRPLTLAVIIPFLMPGVRTHISKGPGNPELQPAGQLNAPY